MMLSPPESGPLSLEEMIRYHRQMIIPGIGEAGQELLKSARVLIAGLGGLGSICAYYLAGAGVGYIRIVDADTVDPTNLNRQILFRTMDIGRSKASQAKEVLIALNPNCRIDAHQETIDINNVMDLAIDIDVIVDGMDNIMARKRLNSASLTLKIPYIFGGVNQFDGMLTTFIPGKTPCFECLFGHIENRTMAKGAPKGIVGPASGIIASIQCLETIKILLGMKPSLARRLLSIHGSDMTMEQIQVEQNPNCPVCMTKEASCDSD